ncbi:hypothetical protein X943_003324 [Babesia divergens]|uniref:Uncharacterized protein n=1 Tax=Babesia divergens TaxID=32595 RepID=A0AAD9G9P2_BABDI|nr:hypothetical protein X943_003324 [Babesia divergens]
MSAAKECISGMLTRVRFVDLVASLEATVLKPENAVLEAQRFQELTLQLYLHYDIALAWHEAQEKDGLLEDAALKSFSDLCLLVLDRYEETHPFLLK